MNARMRSRNFFVMLNSFKSEGELMSGMPCLLPLSRFERSEEVDNCFDYSLNTLFLFSLQRMPPWRNGSVVPEMTALVFSPCRNTPTLVA